MNGVRSQLSICCCAIPGRTSHHTSTVWKSKLNVADLANLSIWSNLDRTQFLNPIGKGNTSATRAKKEKSVAKSFYSDDDSDVSHHSSDSSESSSDEENNTIDPDLTFLLKCALPLYQSRNSQVYHELIVCGGDLRSRFWLVLYTVYSIVGCSRCCKTLQPFGTRRGIIQDWATLDQTSPQSSRDPVCGPEQHCGHLQQASLCFWPVLPTVFCPLHRPSFYPQPEAGDPNLDCNRRQHHICASWTPSKKVSYRH